MENKKVIKVTQKRSKKSFCNIYMDNDDYMELHYDLVLKYGIQKNKIITNELLNSIITEQRVYSVKQIAYNFAAYKPRTEKQIAEKLKLKGFEKNEIDYAIDFLRQFNLIDDIEFARKYINDTLLRKPYSKNKILNELIAKGIRKDNAISLIEKFYPDEMNDQSAEKAFLKKLRSVSSKPEEKKKNALISFMLRQGFYWESINSLLKKHLQ